MLNQKKSISSSHWYRCQQLHLIIAVSVFSFSANAYAHLSLPILSGSSGWEASLDNSTWIPAFGSYPNPITTPVVTTDNDVVGDEFRATLMWYWGEGDYAGTPDGKSGPNTVYFRFSFDLEMLTGGPAMAWVAADDWMRLTVNGYTVGTYTLDDHKLPNGQPDPILMEFTEFLNTVDMGNGEFFLGDGSGQNFITIEAHDGGAVAKDRYYEWIFFDAQHIGPGESVSFQSVPEPASLALAVAGLGAIGAIRYRRRT